MALGIVETRDQGPGPWLFATGRLIEISASAAPPHGGTGDGSSAKSNSTLRMQFSKSESPVRPEGRTWENRWTGCGADRDRTDDIQLAKLALSQLSYSPGRHPPTTAMGLGGLEPPTSRLSGARSSQLSYRPVVHERLSSSFPWSAPPNPWFRSKSEQLTLGLSKPDSKS